MNVLLMVQLPRWRNIIRNERHEFPAEHKFYSQLLTRYRKAMQDWNTLHQNNYQEILSKLLSGIYGHATTN